MQVFKESMLSVIRRIAIFTAGMSLVIGFLISFEAAKAFFLGGFVWLLSQWFMAIKMAKSIRPSQPKQMLASFYANQSIKIIAVAIILAICGTFLIKHVLWLFAGYLFSQFSLLVTKPQTA